MWSMLFERGSDGHTYFEWLMSGLGWTLGLAFCGWWIAFALGVAVGAARTAETMWISVLARGYVEIFRNIPVLVQMFLWYFVLPELLPTDVGTWIKQLPPPWGAFFPALICLSLYTSARVAEQVRAGIEALPRGQAEAAAALGLRRGKTYLLIIIPQALRLIIPSLTSEVMGIYKNTSVALTIGLMELTAQARQISEETFRTFAAFGSATLIYLLLALVAYRLMMWIDQRCKIPGNEPSKAKAKRAVAIGLPEGAKT